ncbi:hypothetical protein BDP55DRAFT_718243 [Colletotrichum godetiae]|uniref:Ubiquitin-like domain-containing protein n=1 Tax=Colletotrichum godetiae TaxID=1209918 RepID=A0AAJ0AEF4_9PEZI|nr:uncharacterized protein BDP55DRAFT_718243 [Colletotrichum godetiae]KAK1672345.1 hypothetical protein BDP55DRAFT_718243 [Colletotrichum godetiae]
MPNPYRPEPDFLDQLVLTIGIAVSKALSDARGSVREYKDLRHDLDRFVQILHHVVATYQEREHSEWLSGINSLIESVSQDCTSDLQEALHYFQSKYGPSLGGQEQRLNTTAIGKKVEYAFREKERLRKLREKLSQATQRLSLLLAIHNYKAARVDNLTLEKRYQEVLSTVEDISKDIELQSMQLSEQHASVKVLITTLTTTSDHLQWRATKDQNLAEELRNNTSSIRALSTMFETTFRLLVEERENATSQTCFRGPGPASQAPLLFEDSFGTISALPMDWLFSWEHLRSMIQNRFEHQLGHQKVIRGEYVLEDDLSGVEIMSLPWAQVMRPGKKINMAMKFQSVTEEGRSRVTEGYTCPGCEATMSVRLDSNGNVMCATTGCGMWVKHSRAKQDAPVLSGSSNSSEDGSKDAPRHFHRVSFDIFVVPSRTSRGGPRSKKYVQVWTCCFCGDSGITTRIDRCPSCAYSRCTRCQVQTTRVR